VAVPGPITHPLLARERLVINQKAKLFELRNQFAILDEAGAPIGSVEQVEQTALHKVVRIFSNLDAALPITLEVRDAGGAGVLRIVKPWFRLTCSVVQPGGVVVGTVRKQIKLGKARFELADAGGQVVGAVLAQNWRARDFSVRDVGDVEVARVTKKWAGLGKELFTDADHYVLEVNPALRDPLRSLAIGSCLAIDTILKQKDSG
jgi:uncharacterized protein YxjI